MTELARWIVVLLQAYLVVGLDFAIAFVLSGVNRIDPAARASTWGFRVMIFPGSVALWPLLLRRWWLGLQPPEERTAHRPAVRKGRR